LRFGRTDVARKRTGFIHHARQGEPNTGRGDHPSLRACADENAIRFGRTKAARVLDAAKADQASARLSQLKFEEE